MTERKQIGQTEKGQSTRLARDLGFLSALSIGVGTMIGAGIFVLPGIVAAKAGPDQVADLAPVSVLIVLISDYSRAIGLSLYSGLWHNILYGLIFFTFQNERHIVKYRKIYFPVLMFSLVWSACSQKALQTSDLESEADKISYSVGYNMGLTLAGQQSQLNMEVFDKGFQDALSGNVPLLDQNQIRTALETFRDIQAGLFSGDRAVLAETNKTEGPTFLAANKEKEGVITLPSGLQYEVLQEGTGTFPQLTDSVSVHYIGSFIDGREFNNSYTNGTPAIFTVNQVIPGWTEALQLMKVGGKWRIWLPSELGYGEAGAGSLIGPNAVLIFEIELLSLLN